MFCVVPQPEVTPVLEDDGTVPLIDPNFFSISFLIVVDPTVIDVPLNVEAVWSGNPSLLDKPRVTVEPTASHPPYFASLIFTSIKPQDLGEYSLSVVVGVSEREGVVSSDEVEVPMTLSLGENTEFFKAVSPYAHIYMYIQYFTSMHHLADLHLELGTTYIEGTLQYSIHLLNIHKYIYWFINNT